MAEIYYRPEPPPSANGWGRSLDREVTAIRREMDQREGLIHDHETRLRNLEATSRDISHDVQSLQDWTDDADRRLTMMERGLRIVTWALVALASKSGPDLAIQIMASVGGR